MKAADAHGQAGAPLTAMAAVRDLLDGWSHCGWTPPERWRPPGRWDETTAGADRVGRDVPPNGRS